MRLLHPYPPPHPPVAPYINRIYYGPPGTGKTYALTRLLKRDYEQPMASVSPQEWRNQIIAEKIAVLKWWEGAAAALYDLGGKAKVPELAEHPFIQAITAAKGRADGIKQTLWGALCNITRFLNQPRSTSSCGLAQQFSTNRVIRCGSSPETGGTTAPI